MSDPEQTSSARAAHPGDGPHARFSVVAGWSTWNAQSSYSYEAGIGLPGGGLTVAYSWRVATMPQLAW